MIEGSAENTILERFGRALRDTYGDRIERIVLFGSRARGDANGGSDYDIAVFLTHMTDRWRELDRMALLRVRFIDETGAVFDAKPFVATAFNDRTPLMHEIRRDGLDL